MSRQARALIFVILFAPFLAVTGRGLALEANPPGTDSPSSGALPGAEGRGAIRQVIESQLAAFQRDDAAGAFAFASPKIQGMFGDPTTFMDMVRTGYRPVYRPQRFEFLGLRALRGQPAQEVLFVGPEGSEVMAVYLMAQQPDGSWRIDGVFLVQPQGETT